jgi:SAM-dependent methyltransferase
MATVSGSSLHPEAIAQAAVGLALALASAVFSAGVGAAEAGEGAATAAEYQPVSGQAGKDSVWVPSPVDTVQKMLDMAKLGPKDFVVDLGSGDGRNIILAARRGARGLGVEFNPDLVQLSRRNAEKEGVAHLVQFAQGDMFEVDFSRATVLALFLAPDNLRRLEPKFRRLAPGTRIVANTFGIDGWTPDRDEAVGGSECHAWCRVMLYTVPAVVEGVWREGGSRFEIVQNVQRLSGERTRARVSMPVEGRVEGTRVRFTAGGFVYTGIVSGDRIRGTVEARGHRRAWTAQRTE